MYVFRFATQRKRTGELTRRPQAAASGGLIKAHPESCRSTKRGGDESMGTLWPLVDSTSLPIEAARASHKGPKTASAEDLAAAWSAPDRRVAT